jgi:hypothetical protein
VDFAQENDMKYANILAVLTALSCSACGGDSGAGDLRISLQAEESISLGLQVGPESENTRDYAVQYTKYLAVVGGVVAARSGHTVRDPGSYLVDLKRIGEEGQELSRLDDLRAGQWPELGFDTPGADGATEVLEGVSAADAEEMKTAGYTYWIAGEVLRPEADGGPVAFEIKTRAVTHYEGCELDGQPGFAVREAGTSEVTLTLHGDHLWFDGFPVGEEGKITRRAAWITKVQDLDSDGVVDTEDLAAADPTVVLAGYDLAGNPGGPSAPIDSALEFARQQLATQGHYKGEGECAWSFDPGA